MKLHDDTINEMGLKLEEVELWNTPFRHLSKEGMQMLASLESKVTAHWDAKNAAARDKERQLSEEERIHKNKERMLKLKTETQTGYRGNG